MPRGRDGRVIIRLGRGDDPHLATAAHPSDPPKHRERRREISRDQVEPIAGDDLLGNLGRPRIAPPHRPRIAPLERARPLAVALDDPAKRPDPRAFDPAPAIDRVEISTRRAHRRSVERQPQVAPVPGPPVGQIIARDIGPANQRLLLIDHQHFLVVAEQVTSPVARVKENELAPAIRDRLKEGRGNLRAEAVEQQSNVDPALGRPGKRIADRFARRIGTDHVKQQTDACLRLVDQAEHRLQSLGSTLEQFEPGARHDGHDPRIWRRRRRIGLGHLGDLRPGADRGKRGPVTKLAPGSRFP